jgi:hypothetical protein
MVTATTTDALTSPALPLLLQLEACGVRFRLDGDHVLVSPRGVLTPEQREVFRQHQAAVRVLVAIVTDAGVQDRAAEFRRQLEATPAPMVPAFLFRLGVAYVQGVCFSCGDALPAPRFGRCWRCSLGWRLAVRLPVPTDVAVALDAAKVCA